MFVRTAPSQGGQSATPRPGSTAGTSEFIRLSTSLAHTSPPSASGSMRLPSLSRMYNDVGAPAVVDLSIACVYRGGQQCEFFSPSLPRPLAPRSTVCSGRWCPPRLPSSAPRCEAAVDAARAAFRAHATAFAALYICSLQLLANAAHAGLRQQYRDRTWNLIVFFGTKK